MATYPRNGGSKFFGGRWHFRRRGRDYLVGMSTTATPKDVDLEGILSALQALERRAGAEITIIEEKLPELRRQARAAPHRRGGAGSRDANKYALGSVLVMVGLEQIEPAVLLGLLTHPELMLRWIAEARLALGPHPFGELIAHVVSDPERREFCRQWGRILEWRYRKPLYDAAVTSFVNSGKTGPREKWRGHDVTDDQAALIEKLCDLLDEPLPDLWTKGEAFDWIYERGGNPEYWAEPEIPEEWRTE